MNPCFSQLKVAHVSASFVAGLASACVKILSHGLVFHTVLMLQVAPHQTNVAMEHSAGNTYCTSLKGPCFIAMIVYQRV